MSDDKRMGWGAPAPKVQGGGSTNARDYVAFHPADRSARLEIVPVDNPTRFMTYTNLLEIIWEHEFAGHIQLIYTFAIVTIKGDNLELVARAIADSACRAIRQYDPKRHDKPPPDAPIIRSIEVEAAHEVKQ
jgi:hypothetical protein